MIEKHRKHIKKWAEREKQDSEFSRVKKWARQFDILTAVANSCWDHQSIRNRT